MYLTGVLLGAILATVNGDAPHQAIAIIRSPDVNGEVLFTRGSRGVTVNGTIKGLIPGKHGFHIHQFGTTLNNCTDAGGHFNPSNKTHGAQDANERHIGDLGNIYSVDGVALISIEDNLISFDGPNNIIGRAIVIHANEDDLGQTDHPDSKKTGNAGGRVACGVIGVKSRSSLLQIHNGLYIISVVTLLYARSVRNI